MTPFKGNATEGLWLMYGPDLEANPPTSWRGLLLDLEKYPGNRGMGAGGQGIIANMQYALIADKGVKLGKRLLSARH